MNTAHQEFVATARGRQSGAACAILGLLAYRAGRGFAERPVNLTEPSQLAAWQTGWTSGYDADKIKDPRKAFNVASAVYAREI